MAAPEVAVVRLFASAREAAGLTSEEIDGATVGDVLDEACRRYGRRFSAVLATSNIWVNGQPAGRSTPVLAADVLAVLPPVSGGSVLGKARRRSTPMPGPDPKPAIVRGNLALVPEPEPEPEGRPFAAPEHRSPPAGLPLAVVPDGARPHGRLGLAWAAVTVGLTVAGPGWLAGWMATAAFVAAAQSAGVLRKQGERPLSVLAAAIAAGLPLAAWLGAAAPGARSSGMGAVNGVIVAGLAASFVARLVWPTRAPSRDVSLTLAIAIPIGLAAASPVLLRRGGMAMVLLLLAFAAVYDAGAYLIGTGATSRWEGPAAGVAAFVPVTILAAVVLIPPLSGLQPLWLGLLAAVLAPIGPLAGSALLGDSAADAPGLRRLDSLLVLGPIWTWCALSFLR